jgi:hypothetical protein
MRLYLYIDTENTADGKEIDEGKLLLRYPIAIEIECDNSEGGIDTDDCIIKIEVEISMHIGAIGIVVEYTPAQRWNNQKYRQKHLWNPYNDEKKALQMTKYAKNL